MMTEDRLISANEALRMILNSKTDGPCLDTIRKGVWDIAHDCAISCVDACPTVDAVEVVHGQWARKQIGKYTGTDEVVCSCCGCFLAVVGSDAGFKEATRDMNYCHNCGAKMDWGANNG